MLIAERLKAENAAEFVLYIWQTEDLLRACGLDMDVVEARVLRGFDEGDGEASRRCEWYASMIEMMRSEGVTEAGHLQVGRNVVSLLTDLHHALLASEKMADYKALYYRALPFIVELRAKGGGTQKPEIENCLDALYGLMLLRLKGQPVSEGTKAACALIARLVGTLSALYKKEGDGQLDL